MTTGRRIRCPACGTHIHFETHEIDDGYIIVPPDPADLLVTCSVCGRIFQLIRNGRDWYSVELPPQ